MSKERGRRRIKKNLGIHTPLSLASAGDKAIALPEVVP